MNLYKELKLTPVRSEPDVWISRLVIFEQIEPKSVVIRDISLTRGLNIVWAEEVEDDNPAAEITGHSAGKTTFCRLLRYVLGETTFGTKAAMELIHKAFPNGYVAAELYVRSQRWAVRRPFGGGRMSYIRQNSTIEELLKERGRSASQESYPKEIGLEALLDDLETGGIVQTGETIQWGHILAWCARDQEMRFQNIYDWRSPRSDADTPAFRFPKSGPLFVMRTVLGLFLPDELKGEERLAKLQREKDKLTKAIEEKRREPQFRINLYDHQLRQRLRVALPDEADIDSRPFRSDQLLPEDLGRLAARAEEQTKSTVEELEGERTTLQAHVDDLGAEIRQREGELAQVDAFFDLSSAAAEEFDSGLSQRKVQRKKIEELKNKLCPLGGVLFGDCSHVQERLHVLQVTQLQDAHMMEQAETKRLEECQKIKEERTHLCNTIERLKQERQSALTKRDALLAGVRKKQEESHDLQRARDELEAWTQRRDQPGGYKEIDNLRQKLNDTEEEIVKTEGQLADFLRQHDENRELLAAIFSASVRSVLSAGSYDGEVSLENRELAFRITHGPAMSGEAVETLSVLLSDAASLVYNTVSDKAHLPGFMLHDSPREADLGIRIYRSFIRFMASLQEHFGVSDKCPFQYVLTTTTPPPDELCDESFLKLKLNAADLSGLLLRKNVAAVAAQDEGLFSDTTPES